MQAGLSGVGTTVDSWAWWSLGADCLLAVVCLLTALGLLTVVRARIDAMRRPAVCWGGALALA